MIFTKLYYDAVIHISYLHNDDIHSAYLHDAVIHISYLHNGDIH